MEFLVIGQDAAIFDYGSHELHEQHQVYMDSWSDRLIARGPLLSADDPPVDARRTGAALISGASSGRAQMLHPTSIRQPGRGRARHLPVACGAQGDRGEQCGACEQRGRQVQRIVQRAGEGRVPRLDDLV